MKKVYLFGTGADAEQVYYKIKSYKNFYDDHILGFLDNNAHKWGEKFHEYDVLPPEVIRESDFDFIVVCSINYQYEIRQQLKERFGVSAERIIFWREYISGINISFQYRRSLTYERDCVVHKDKFDTSNTVVYTAIEGGCDNLREPEFIGDNITYVCFTDNRNIKSDVWDIRYVETPKDKNYALDVRKYKVLPQDYFEGHSLTIWVDASFRIMGNLNDYAKKYNRGSGMLCFPHPERKCIYQECGELITISKEEPAILIKQASDYLNDGYPADNGLYAGGVLVRDIRDECLNKCMRDWWEEINRQSLRDQQSLPYVLWKNKYDVDLCDLDINNNIYLKNNAHLMGHWKQEREI